MLTFFIYNLPKSRFTFNPVIAQKRMMAKYIFKGLKNQALQPDPEAIVWKRKLDPNKYFLLTATYSTLKQESEAYNKTIAQLSNNINQKTDAEEELRGKKSKIKLPRNIAKKIKETSEQIAAQTSQASAMTSAGIFYSLYSTVEGESFNNYDMFNEKEKTQIISMLGELNLPFGEMTENE